MNKRSLLLMSLLCAFMAMPTSAIVQCGSSNGYISVSSTSQKEVEPNIAQMTFTVETTDKTVEGASIENKVIVAQVMSALKNNIDTNAGEDIKTSNFSVRPNYTYSKDNKRSLDNYTVTNSIKVKTKKISSIGKLIDIAINKGANRLDTLNFSLDNEKNICNDLYPQVVKDAQTQASIIARALNLNVVGLKSLNANCSAEYSGNMPYGAMFAKSANESVGSIDTPIESGKIKVNATVNADFNVQ